MFTITKCFLLLNYYYNEKQQQVVLGIKELVPRLVRTPT